MARKKITFSEDVILEELRARELLESADSPGERSSNCACNRRRRGQVFCRCLDVRTTSARKVLRELPTPELIETLRTTQKVVYGVDDRTEIFNITELPAQRDATGVVAVVDAANVTDNGNGTMTLSGPTFKDEYSLCDGEAFADQPLAAHCSGFLADPSLVVTAGHCVENSNLASKRFVFGYEMTDATTARMTVPARDVVSGIRIIGRQELAGGGDWAVVQLERPVVHRTVLPIRRTGKVPDAAPLHVIGHPVGLPKKYAPGAQVRSNTNDAFFVANLDTYGGNSGSPVFHAETHVVEGVLVRGENDFSWTGSCYVSNVCPAGGCRGEDCTRVSEFERLIPEHSLECVHFDPASINVDTSGANAVLRAGDVLIRDFGTETGDAERAREIFARYQFNVQCLIGREPRGAAMEFYLSNGAAPSGPIPNDDCIGFEPGALEVLRVGGRWKIVEDARWLLDFDQNEARARLALSTILRHRFRYICFVGRPDASLTYFRI